MLAGSGFFQRSSRQSFHTGVHRGVTTSVLHNVGNSMRSSSDTVRQGCVVGESVYMRDFFTRVHVEVGTFWCFFLRSSRHSRFLAVHARVFAPVPTVESRLLVPCAQRRTVGATVKTPATNTELANFWMMEKRKTRPGEGLHDTHTHWAKQCRTFARAKGQELDGDGFSLDSVMLTSRDLQRNGKCASSDLTDF